MNVVARPGWEEVGWGTPLVRALVRGALADAPPGPRDVARADADPEVLAALAAANPLGSRAPWEQLRAAGARAVVTGQQPGCAGGPLLALYKAATACALARELTATSARPVVPIFWNAADDDDFHEIATIAMPAEDDRVLYLDLAGAGRRAAGWVGDLPASGDDAAASAAQAALSPARAAALAAYLPRAAADHGDWVGALFGRIFPELAILDARSAALRLFAADLFARYLDRRDAAVAAVEAETRGLAAQGFAPTLDANAARHALFLTRERRREKTPADLEPLRQALAGGAADLSPNVALRPLVQDTLLPVVAQVVGPSEIGYLFELRGLRRLLGVPEPALVPRLSCTLFEPGHWEAARALGIAPADLVADPERGVREAAVPFRPPVPELDASLAELTDALARAPLRDAARRRAERQLAAWRSEVDGELDATARAALRERWPATAGLPNLLRPRGRPQERVFGTLWPLAAWGPEAGERLIALAHTHLEALDAGRAEHSLVVL